MNYQFIIHEIIYYEIYLYMLDIKKINIKTYIKVFYIYYLHKISF